VLELLTKKDLCTDTVLTPDLSPQMISLWGVFKSVRGAGMTHVKNFMRAAATLMRKSSQLGVRVRNYLDISSSALRYADT